MAGRWMGKPGTDHDTITFDWMTKCKTIKKMWFIDWWSSRIQSPRVRSHDSSSACLCCRWRRGGSRGFATAPCPTSLPPPRSTLLRGPIALWEHRLLAKWYIHTFARTDSPPLALLEVCLWVLRNPSRNRCPTTARRNYCTCGQPFCTHVLLFCLTTPTGMQHWCVR